MNPFKTKSVTGLSLSQKSLALKQRLSMFCKKSHVLRWRCSCSTCVEYMTFCKKLFDLSSVHETPAAPLTSVTPQSAEGNDPIVHFLSSACYTRYADIPSDIPSPFRYDVRITDCQCWRCCDCVKSFSSLAKSQYVTNLSFSPNAIVIRERKRKGVPACDREILQINFLAHTNLQFKVPDYKVKTSDSATFFTPALFEGNVYNLIKRVVDADGKAMCVLSLAMNWKLYLSVIQTLGTASMDSDVMQCVDGLMLCDAFRPVDGYFKTDLLPFSDVRPQLFGAAELADSISSFPQEIGASLAPAIDAMNRLPSQIADSVAPAIATISNFPSQVESSAKNSVDYVKTNVNSIKTRVVGGVFDYTMIITDFMTDLFALLQISSIPFRLTKLATLIWKVCHFLDISIDLSAASVVAQNILRPSSSAETTSVPSSTPADLAPPLSKADVDSIYESVFDDDYWFKSSNGETPSASADIPLDPFTGVTEQNLEAGALGAVKVVACSLFTLLFVFAARFIPGSAVLPDAKLFDDLVRRLAFLPRSLQCLAGVFEKCSEWFDVIWRYICEYFGIAVDEKSVSKLDEFVLEVDTLAQELQSRTMMMEDVDRLARFGSHRTSLYKNFRFEVVSNNDRLKFNMASRSYDALVDKARSHGFLQKGGSPATFVQFVGVPKIGKSKLLLPMTKFLSKPLCIARSDNIKDHVYSLSGDLKHFDGYNGHKVIVFDDYFQTLDSPASPNPDIMTSIRLKNECTYIVPMADLHDKGMVFSSNLIIASSNKRNYTIKSISEPNALWRRIDHQFYVTLKAEYTRDGVAQTEIDPIDPLPFTLSIPKIKAAFPEFKPGQFLMDIYNVYALDPTANGTTITLDPRNALSMLQCWSLIYHDMERVSADRDARDEELETFYDLEVQSGELVECTPEPSMYATVSENLSIIADKIRSAAETLKPFMTLKNIIIATLGTCGALFGASLIQQSFFPTPPQKVSRRMTKACRAVCRTMYTKYNKEDFGTEDYCSVCIDALESVGVTDTRVQEINCHLLVLLERSGALRCPAHMKSRQDPFDGVCPKCNWKDIPCMLRMFSVNASCTHFCPNVAEMYQNKDRSRVVRENYSSVSPSKIVRSEQKRDPAEDIEPEQYSQSTKTKAVRTEEFTSVVAHMSLDQNLSSLIGNKLSANGIHLRVTRPSGRWTSTSGTFIGGQLLLVNRHAVHGLSDDCVLALNFTNGAVLNVNWSDVTPYFASDRNDVCLLFCSQFPRKMCIVKNFVSESTLDHNKVGNMVMCGVNPKHMFSQKFSDYIIRTQDQDVTIPVGEIIVKKSIRYTMDTEAGECGQLLCVRNAAINDKIMGMHAFGANPANGGVVVTREMLIEMLGSIRKSDPTHVSIPDFSGLEKYGFKAEFLESLEGHLHSVGSMKPAFQPSKTDLRPVLHWDKLSADLDVIPKTRPAILKPFTRDGERIDPLFKGLSKVSENPTMINASLVDATERIVERLLLTNHVGSTVKPRLIDMNENIFGSDEVREIDLNTSVGLPLLFDKQSNMRGKREWIDNENKSYAPVLDSLVSAKLDGWSSGDFVPSVFCANLKDERRPHEKVLAGKTRIIYGGPLDFTLAFRRLFLSFINFLQDNRIFNGIGVGINPFGGEWELAFQHLNKFGGNRVIAGDFSNFDGTNALGLQDIFLKIANKFYSDGNDVMRTNAWRDVTHCLVAARGTLFTTIRGMASGCPVTSVANSVYNISACIYVLLEALIAKGYSVVDASELIFTKFVVLVYGDDNILSFSVDFPITPVEISTGFTRIGMKYTDETKADASENFRNLYEVTFLKRYFLFCPRFGVHLAPMETDALIDQLFWYRNGPDCVAQMVVNAENVMRELSLWQDEVFFERVRMILYNNFRHYNLLPTVYCMNDTIDHTRKIVPYGFPV